MLVHMLNRQKRNVIINHSNVHLKFTKHKSNLELDSVITNSSIRHISTKMLPIYEGGVSLV